jgi:protein-tyrosine phosphatase
MSKPAFIDIHSHLLPGIDDGCTSLTESFACVRQLAKHGFSGTICTPHVCVPEFPDNTPASINHCVSQLRHQLGAVNLDYSIWPGAEVRMTPETVAWFRRHGVPTLGSSHCVLVDYWSESWEPFCQQILDYLFDEGYQPVLAHPERMPIYDDQLEEILLELQSSGVWLQGNLRCIAGVEGVTPHTRMRRWLAEDRYEIIATDMHRPECLDERLDGISVVEEQLGPRRLQSLLGERVGKLLRVGSTTDANWAESVRSKMAS